MARGKINCKIYPDENLEKIIGKEPVVPTEMIKRLWNYIKKHDLKKLDKDIVAK